MKKAAIKGVLSTILMMAFAFLAVTGALLYFGKTGVIWGVSRQFLRSAHFWVAVSICVLIIAHITLNFRLYRSELQPIKKRKDI